VAASYQLVTPLSGVRFLLAKLVARDRLGEPFRYEYHLLTEKVDLDFDQLLGQAISLTLTDANSTKRFFNGVVTRVSVAGQHRGHQVFQVVVRPQWWLLKQSRDCRIFQDLSIPEIVKQVLSAGNVVVRDELTETYAKLDYCVQYRESAFDFVSRLLEQEGIYYFFVHSATQHEMVLVDSSSAHDPIAGNADLRCFPQASPSQTVECLWSFSPSGRVTSGTTVLNDYDFKNPRAALEARSQELANYDLEQGEVYDYPGKYLVVDAGQTYARLRREELQRDAQLCQGEGSVFTLVTGGLFTLVTFPRSADRIEYLVTSSELVFDELGLDEPDLSQGSREDERRKFQVRFEAIPSTKAFRPPRRTPRPVVGGPHTAMVVGKAGEEIWTDEYGRVRVQFHWDREGQKDENSSCWLRVAQGWAGAQWGSWFLPRIGQEVIVQFLEGDPDRPLVTGSLYNADQMPPYALPANMTQSGIKTRSTKEGTEENFNELRFEDKKDEEEIYFHAERDFNRVVENNDTLKVGFVKKEDGDQTIDIYNNRTVTLDQGNDKLQIKTGNSVVQIDTGDASLTVSQGKRTEQIHGNSELTVDEGNQVTTVSKGNANLTVSQGDHTIDVTAGSCTIEAAQKILLKVGGSSIEITPSGIKLTANTIELRGTSKVAIDGGMNAEVKASMGVSIDGGLSVEAKGVNATLQGQAMTTVKGGIVMIN